MDTMIWYGESKESGKWYESEKGQEKGRQTPGRDKPLAGRRIKDRKVKTINYVFYKKPMATRLGILQRSACNENIKVSTACAEFIRRWKNCSETTPKETIKKISTEYADDLIGMGFKPE